MGNFIDLTGQKFGRLTVIERAGNNKCRTDAWLCKCSCGEERVIDSRRLTSGNTKSCGCYKAEYIRVARQKHGKSRTKIYTKWKTMKDRCYNPKSNQYKNYGARGIITDTRWKDDFQVFYDDVSKLPHFGEEGYSLNRIDNDGNYELSNIEWATNIEQQNNKRNNHLIEYNGKTQTLTQWAMKYGLNFWTLKERLKRGWSIEKALTTPTKAK